MEPHPYRRAFAARDLDGLAGLLAEKTGVSTKSLTAGARPRNADTGSLLDVFKALLGRRG
jgi:hypothetical protein